MSAKIIIGQCVNLPSCRLYNWICSIWFSQIPAPILFNSRSCSPYHAQFPFFLGASCQGKGSIWIHNQPGRPSICLNETVGGKHCSHLLTVESNDTLAAQSDMQRQGAIEVAHSKLMSLPRTIPKKVMSAGDGLLVVRPIFNWNNLTFDIFWP